MDATQATKMWWASVPCQLFVGPSFTTGLSWSVGLRQATDRPAKKSLAPWACLVKVAVPRDALVKFFWLQKLCVPRGPKRNASYQDCSKSMAPAFGNSHFEIPAVLWCPAAWKTLHQLVPLARRRQQSLCKATSRKLRQDQQDTVCASSASNNCFLWSNMFDFWRRTSLREVVSPHESLAQSLLSTSVHTGGTDSAWKLCKASLPASVVTRSAGRFNPKMDLYIRAWQWRWENSASLGANLCKKTAQVFLQNTAWHPWTEKEKRQRKLRWRCGGVQIDQKMIKIRTPKSKVSRARNLERFVTFWW